MTSNPPIILGINAAHDASACLISGGTLISAISEERLSRIKHDGGFPARAVEYCVKEGGLAGLEDVDCLVLNEQTRTDHTLDLRNHGFAGELITNPSHHLLHAYYAWVASGFSDAAILIVDGSGYSYGEHQRRASPLLGDPPPYSEMEEAESAYLAQNGTLELMGKRWALWQASTPYFRFGSLGHMFSMASQYIFGHWQHAGKTMGLAPYGDASSFPEPFLDIRGDALEIRTDWVTKLPPRSPEPAHLDQVSCDLAAKVQAELERAMLHLCHQLHRTTGQDNLCISGGVALNSVVNGTILRESPFKRLFVTPAAGDAGVAIGAALYGHHRMTGTVPRWKSHDDYHGRTYSDSDIAQAIDQRKSRLRWNRVEDPATLAAQDISAVKVVGWFERGSEFGPRALGHRSILADARNPAMRDRLNKAVKFREPFRPYAASVLAEHVPEYFDISASDPFMLVVATVRTAYREVVPSICHVDGTCRIQSVDADRGDRFRRVLESFYATTGVPLVLNTSFNIRGEPVVETPGDAIDCFLGSNIDALYLEDIRITKADISTAENPGALIPYLSNALEIATVTASADGAAQPPRHHASTRTGHRSPISQEDTMLLQAVDGRRAIDDIAAATGTEPAATGVVFADLNRRGFVSFGFGATPEGISHAGPVHTHGNQ